MKIRIIDDTQDEGFVQIPNSTVRNTALTWKARGVLAYLLSHATGYSLNYNTVLNASEKDGAHSTRTALTELEDNGYLIREQGRGGEGTFGSSVWRLHRRGGFLNRQEEIPLQFDREELVPDNMEFFPGKKAGRRSSAAVPATTAREFAEAVFTKWHEMILAARPVDVFRVEYKKPTVTDKRLKAIGVRMLDEYWMKSWQDAITRLGKIDGMHGKVEDRDGRTFMADVDFFLRPDSVVKIMEGKYDNWTRRDGHKPAEAAKKAYSGGL